MSPGMEVLSRSLIRSLVTWALHLEIVPIPKPTRCDRAYRAMLVGE
jgi:hypothetical protein